MSNASLHPHRLRADLIEFENSFEVARADLEARVSSIVGGVDPFGLFEEDEDGKRRLDKEALAGLLNNLDGVGSAVADAFEDFDWSSCSRPGRVLESRQVARAFRTFKKALV
jgi:hypothetical protein